MIAATKKVQERPIVVRRFPSLDNYTPCHILFVPKQTAPETRAAAIEKSLTDPVLIVGESPGFAAAGGVINFFLAGANVKFEINREAEKQRQLALDAKLLRLATIVNGS